MRIVALLLVVVGGPAALVAQGQRSIPLRAGLTIVKAVEMTQGDAEMILRVGRVDAEGVHFSFSGDLTPSKGTDNPLDGLLSGIISKPAAKPEAKPDAKPATAGESVRITGTRTVLRVDLGSARHLYSAFGSKQPRTFPGSTSLGTSAVVLTELKKNGQAAFSCQCDPELFSGIGALTGAIAAMAGNSDPERGKLSGTLKRVEPDPVPVQVLVNDILTALPTIHARGKLGDEEGDFYFLDDEQNPLALRVKVGENGFQVVKLTFQSEQPETRIAAALEKTGRAEIYGIYFDFGSATLRAESGPVLKEIADLMTANSTWKLSIEGHTDNVGGAAPNLELSRQRAAAVKQALVTRHQVDGARLATTGFGASRPKQDNDTAVGRARNRRVELARQ